MFRGAHVNRFILPGETWQRGSPASCEGSWNELEEWRV